MLHPSMCVPPSLLRKHSQGQRKRVTLGWWPLDKAVLVHGPSDDKEGAHQNPRLGQAPGVDADGLPIRKRTWPHHCTPPCPSRVCSKWMHWFPRAPCVHCPGQCQAERDHVQDPLVHTHAPAPLSFCNRHTTTSPYLLDYAGCGQRNNGDTGSPHTETMEEVTLAQGIEQKTLCIVYEGDLQPTVVINPTQ